MTLNASFLDYLNGGLEANLSRRARSARAAAVSALIGFIGFIEGFRKPLCGIFPERDINNPRIYLGAWLRLGLFPAFVSPILGRVSPLCGVSIKESLVENVSSRATTTFFGFSIVFKREKIDLSRDGGGAIILRARPGFLAWVNESCWVLRATSSWSSLRLNLAN